MTASLSSTFDHARLSPSERQIMKAVRAHPGIARAALPSWLDLAQQSVHRIVERLRDQDLLRLAPLGTTKPGKPSPGVWLRETSAYAFGVTINTDSVVLALLDLGGNLIEQRHFRTEPLSRDKTLTTLQSEMTDILRHQKIDRSIIVGAGIAIGGYFYGENRERICTTEPLRDWSFIPLVPLLQEALNLNVVVANNARTSACGERLRGVCRNYDTFAYLHFHFVFGPVIVIDRRPYLGPLGNTGENGIVY